MSNPKKNLKFDNRNVFIVTASLKPSAGGRTSSLIRRARILTESSNEKITICSISYDPNYTDSFNELLSSKKINSNISISNIYDDLMGDSQLKEEVRHDTNDKCFTVSQSGGHRYIHFKGAIRKYIKDFDKITKKLGHINYYEEGYEHVSARAHYDSRGLLHRKDIFSKSKYTLLQQIYYDRSGQEYLTKYFETVDSNTLLAYIVYCGGKLGGPQLFCNFEELCTFWLADKIKTKTVFISDARILDEAVLAINNELAVKIFQFHGNYHTKPHDLSSPFIRRLQPLLNNILKADSIVTLTESQLENLSEQIPDGKSKYVHISHCMNAIPITYRRDLKTISVVSRLAKVKRVDHVIKAFAIFLEKHPDYILNIYGDGDDKEKLEGLIKEYKVSEACFLRGYTKNPFKVFQESAFSVVSSQSEGFCLSVIESLANGCPVVSYDINFGPRDMIKHGFNGYLAKDGNIQSLAENMSLMAQSSISSEDSKIQSSIVSFGEDSFIEKWFDLINKH